MLAVQWLILMLCSMVAVVVFFGGCAPRRSDDSEEDRGLRSWLLRLGAVLDATGGSSPSRPVPAKAAAWSPDKT